jgi:membrane associated rhomboid family serine protease
VLALPLVAGMLGIFFNFNPAMRIAKLFLRKRPSEYAQEDRDQQRFNQMIAVCCLFLGIIGYWLHWMAIAYIFTILVAVAAFIAILGFCIGCFILFQWKQYQYRHKSRRA